MRRPPVTAGHLLFRDLARRAEGLVHCGQDQVLEHVDVLRIDRRRIDRHTDEFLLPGRRRPDDTASRRTLDDGRLELRLHAQHLLLHLLRHPLQVLHPHGLSFVLRLR